MEKRIETQLNNLQAKDKNVRYEAFMDILSVTEEKVDWAYEIWEQFARDLSDSDPHRRAVAAQILCRLAKSDPENRLKTDFPKILAVTKDEKFVTARHSLQSLWHIALAGAEQQEMVIQSLAARFHDCTSEKNYTLIRFDIIQSLKNLYEKRQDEEIKEIALELINIEEDPKYKKKYNSVWK
ncbi:hypothetical protein [Alkalihalobacterium alkalinitrilicum]|uniref:hypothetical protein n=1 Tax=Alkalihalobacterium alkalinitrilicum TaxID=427920 RepID=UPI000995B40A|nr:hypothetical protein [Alkalihalobacterium alkalinitrilicum]